MEAADPVELAQVEAEISAWPFAQALDADTEKGPARLLYVPLLASPIDNKTSAGRDRLTPRL